MTLILVAATTSGGPPWSISRSVGGERLGVISAVSGARDLQSAAPAQPAKAVAPPIGDDEDAAWTQLAIYRAGPNRPRAILAVRRAEQVPATNIDDPVSREVLLREVVRQGVLLAARQGFDILVRDLAIGDPDEWGQADATYRLGSIFQTTGSDTLKTPPGGRITIVEGWGGDRRVVWHHGLDCIEAGRARHDRLVGQVEVLARTDFRDVLAGWKLPPTPTSKTSKKPKGLPPAVEKRLLSLVETEQFAALRALHEAVRRDGGSPERWEALSRGYAMLGSLTEPLLDTSHVAFKARSLLYAQEAVVADQGSAQALREQAFAEAMVGLFPQARSHLDQADRVDASGAKTPRARMIRAYLATDPDALGKLAAESPDDLTPLYLQAIVRSRLSGMLGTIERICRNEIIANLDQVLSKVPDCHRVVDAMCEASGVANRHRATTIDLESFASTSLVRVAAVPGLPASIARGPKAGGGVDEVALRESLDKASRVDGNDLTWGVLARQLREIRFLQVCRRLQFLAYSLASGASEFVEVARPMVVDHPNHDYIELFPGNLDRKRAIEILGQLDFADLELKNLTLMYPVGLVEKERRAQLYNTSTQDGWGTVQNCERHLRWAGNTEFRMRFAKALLKLDPSSPVARSALVEVDWSDAAATVADWEREQPWNTPIFASHGFQLLKEKRFAEAQDLLQRALDRSPDFWIFAGLTRSFRERGQVDRWVKEAEAMLERPDQSLDHANIANELAQFLMDNGQVDRAWPWAERAAESWAGWAMKTAWKCAEMRRDWENAELWVSRSSERYDNQWLEWLAWCVRTGHGNRKAASELVWTGWDARKTVDSDEQAMLLANLALILGRADVARQLSEVRVEANPKSTGDVLNLALACDRLGDIKARDQALDRIVAGPNPSSPKTAKMIAGLVEWHRHRDTAKLDLAVIDAVIAELPPERRPLAHSWVGLYLDMFGRRDEALRHLKAADADGNLLGSRLLVRHTLRSRGERLGDFLFTTPKKSDAVPPSEGPKP